MCWTRYAAKSKETPGETNAVLVDFVVSEQAKQTAKIRINAYSFFILDGNFEGFKLPFTYILSYLNRQKSFGFGRKSFYPHDEAFSVR